MAWFKNAGGRTVVLASAMVLTMAAGLAVAQPEGRKDALRGPAVTDRGVPGDNRRLAEGTDFERGRERGMPPMAFMRAINALRGEKAPEGLALTDEQSTKIKGFADEYRASLEKYREAHGEEIRGLMKDLTPEARREAMQVLGPVMAAGRRGEAGGREGGARREGGPERERGPGRGEGRPERERGERPDDDGMRGDDAPAADPAKSAAAKEKIKQLLEQAPKADGVRTQVFGVLSAEQKTFVEKELEKFKQQGDERMGKRKAEQQLKKGEQSEGDRAEKRREMREKLKNMTPEERKKAVEELREKRKGG